MTTVTALEEVVDRHGRSALSDPIVLTGALRSLPEPPPAAEISALAAAAGAGAAERMRTVLEEGGSPAEALQAATEASGDDWACRQLGTALGYLPRDTDEPTTALDDGATTVLSTGKPERGKRIAVIAGAVVLVAAVAATGVALALGRDGEPKADDAPTPPSVSSTEGLGSAPAAEPSATPTSVPAPTSANPGAAFKDPDLLAAAKPYLDHPDVRCEPAKSIVSVRESVTCELGSGVIASFRVLFFPKQLDKLRTVLQTDNDGARPGSIRTLRWEYVQGQPGVRAGIPVGTQRPGNGTRIRFLEPENGYARLYFDEDATGVAVYMQASTGDQQVLRKFWADPDA
ncbi:hypothetical protein [Amycolatopsis pittospori]|uniref:hypothetical protein n=1 Tax=Amycolatopsis pittospori TaxID=2749434 RepID=UPI0015F00B92|nr:hypothetical protein [Amycolatopsis pittospori]